MRTPTSFIVACFIIVTSLAPPLNAEVWRINSLEWPPYAGENLKDNGAAVAELRRVLAKGGITLEVNFLPWERAQRIKNEAQAIGYFPAWPEEVRKGFVTSEPVMTSYINVIYRKSDPIAWGSMMNLFYEHKVGLISSYIYPNAIEEASKRFPLNVVLAPEEISLVKMLNAGRMDAALTDAKVSKYYARQLGITNIEGSESFVDIKPLVVAFVADKNSTARLEKLRELLAKYGNYQAETNPSSTSRATLNNTLFQ